LKRHHDDRTIIFTANNDFAYDISREFIVPCITHQTKTDERTEILDRFRSGEYSMLVTSQVLDEGIDVPAANVGIILSGSASKTPVRATAWPHPATHGRPPARAALRDHHRGYDGDVRLPTPP